MSGASIEATLELWSSSLSDVKVRIRSLFTQERVATSASLFLDGLLGDERRKTGWMRAEAAGDPGPWRQQALLGRGRWNADALRDIVRDYVVENLAADDAVLVIDETGFLKQGKASCGVGRQYTGSAGVEPRRRGRRVMEHEARMAVEPGQDVGVFVGGVIVEDHVDHLSGGDFGLDRVEKADELLMAMTLHAASDDGALQDVERREQRGRPVADVIVGHGQ